MNYGYFILSTKNLCYLVKIEGYNNVRIFDSYLKKELHRRYVAYLVRQLGGFEAFKNRLVKIEIKTREEGLAKVESIIKRKMLVRADEKEKLRLRVRARLEEKYMTLCKLPKCEITEENISVVLGYLNTKVFFWKEVLPNFPKGVQYCQNMDKNDNLSTGIIFPDGRKFSVGHYNFGKSFVNLRY